MANKQKQRGKYFEDKISKIIIESANLEKDSVHRALASGVYHTEYGDIYFKDNPHNLIIECKYRKQWDFKHIIKWSKPITDYWQQLMTDVNRYSKNYKINLDDIIPILVISRPYDDIYAITEGSIVDKYNIDTGAFSFLMITSPKNDSDKLVCYFDELIKLIYKKTKIKLNNP